MIDKFTTCRSCPDRAVGCHGTCAGYQAREQEKAQRYALRAAYRRGQPEHRAQNEMERRYMRRRQINHKQT